MNKQTVAIIADVHIGNHRIHGGQMRAGLNDRARAVLAVLQKAVDKANELELERLVIAGDLFDVDKPRPSLTYAVQNILAGCKARVIAIVGNHDQTSFEIGDNALAPLEALIDVVTDYEAHDEMALLGFEPGPTIDWLPGKMSRAKDDGCDLIVSHFGLVDDHFPPWLQNAPGSVHVRHMFELCEQYGIKRVYTGDYHGRHVWSQGGIDLVQVGALCPVGWQDPGNDYGYMDLLNPIAFGKVEPIRIPGPRFLSFDSAGTLKKFSKWAKRDGDSLYVRYSTDPSNIENAVAELQSWKEDGLVQEGTVVTDDTEAIAAVKQAAVAASSATSIEDAVAAYVENLGVTNPELVIKKVMDYIG